MNRRDALKALLALPVFGKIMAEAKTEAIEVVNTSFKEATPANFKNENLTVSGIQYPTGKVITGTCRICKPYYIDMTGCF